MLNLVGIYRQSQRGYSEKPPYFPPCIFEEYPFKDNRIDAKNELYSSFRQLLFLLGLDADNFGKKDWNPFGGFIIPGQTVFIKPNFVRDLDERGRPKVRGIIVHGSLVRAVIDYVYIALKGKGRIIVADGPVDDASFEKIESLTGLYEIKRFYKDFAGFEIEIYDLRQEKVIKRKGEIIDRIRLKGDPAGYTSVDMGGMSYFKDDSLDYLSFRGAECKTDVMFQHHNANKNEYLISNTFLDSDVVINIAKMKTHKRSGVTLTLKNLIGVTGDRNWLPHFNSNNGNQGPIGRGRDIIRIFLKGIFRRLSGPMKDTLKQFYGVTDEAKKIGNWYGNDIIWRTILDLVYISRFADRRGVIRKDRQRKMFSIIDGIVAGEGDGPLNPIEKPCGILIAGFNEFYVDMVTARLMGFDVMKIPKFKNLLKLSRPGFGRIDLEDIRCVSNQEEWDLGRFADFSGRCLNFRPHYGWKGYIEVQDNGRK